MIIIKVIESEDNALRNYQIIDKQNKMGYYVYNVDFIYTDDQQNYLAEYADCETYTRYVKYYADVLYNSVHKHITKCCELFRLLK